MRGTGPHGVERVRYPGSFRQGGHLQIWGESKCSDDVLLVVEPSDSHYCQSHCGMESALGSHNAIMESHYHPESNKIGISASD